MLASTALIAGASLGLGASAAHAQSATWAGPGADWDTGANWSPAGVPTATAIFTGATPTSITFSQAATSINTIQFNAGAPNYTFTLQSAGTQSLTISGTGIVNNAVGAPTFIDGTGGTINFQNATTAANANIQMHGGTLNFQNTSNAGTAVITTPDQMHVGFINFRDQSSAGSANITMVGSVGLPRTQLNFLDQSTAGNATITNNLGLLGEAADPVRRARRHRHGRCRQRPHHQQQHRLHQLLRPTVGEERHHHNNSGGTTEFQDQSTAANATIVNSGTGRTNFGVAAGGTDTATAGNANITNNSGGITEFLAATTAGNATITNNAGGFLNFGSGFFGDTATAGNAIITNSGIVTFNAATTAGNATITTNNGGNVYFSASSTGGTARFITNAGGTFDMSGLFSGGMTAGSIEGAGNYFLGAKQLTVGGNNLSTTVSGAISDGGTSGGIGGSLVKIGSGTLTLAGANTYRGATTVDGGVLEVNGSIAFRP